MIGLDPQLVELLRSHKRRSVGRSRPDGAGDEDLVFAHRDGRPLHPERVSRWFSQAVATTAAPHVRLHDLRHLHATLALEAGVAPRVLADRLGHSSTAVTTDIYQHVRPDMDHDAARRVADLVFTESPWDTTEGGRL